jgi:hypothetical protein
MGQGSRPGKGHRGKSDPPKTKRFQKKAAKAREAAQKAYDEAVKRWEGLDPAAKKLLPELDPKYFKP